MASKKLQNAVREASNSARLSARIVELESILNKMSQDLDRSNQSAAALLAQLKEKARIVFLSGDTVEMHIHESSNLAEGDEEYMVGASLDCKKESALHLIPFQNLEGLPAALLELSQTLAKRLNAPLRVETSPNDISYSHEDGNDPKMFTDLIGQDSVIVQPEDAPKVEPWGRPTDVMKRETLADAQPVLNPHTLQFLFDLRADSCDEVDGQHSSWCRSCRAAKVLEMLGLDIGRCVCGCQLPVGATECPYCGVPVAEKSTSVRLEPETLEATGEVIYHLERADHVHPPRLKTFSLDPDSHSGVFQRNKFDCGVAAIATVLSTSYEKAASIMRDPSQDFAREDFSDPTDFDVLLEQVPHPNHPGQVYLGINELEIAHILAQREIPYCQYINPKSMQGTWFSHAAEKLGLPQESDIFKFLYEGQGLMAVPSPSGPGVSHWLVFDSAKVWDSRPGKGLETSGQAAAHMAAGWAKGEVSSIIVIYGGD